MKTLNLSMAVMIAVPVWGAVHINEVQISNDITILDENGEHPDWVELYNDSDSAVNLSGWGLSDKASKPYKWVFPENTYIMANGYLTVFADGRENGSANLPAPMQPNELGDDLVAWFTGDQALESVGAGSRVGQWVDLSDWHNNATNNSATETTRPIVITNAINGHAALNFSASDKTILNLNKNNFSGMSSMSNFTVLVVAKWNGTCWYFYNYIKYEFKLQFEIPATYPATPIELELPELDGKTPKMYRGGKICLDIHFAPLWAKMSPKYGIAHALALAVS